MFGRQTSFMECAEDLPGKKREVQFWGFPLGKSSFKSSLKELLLLQRLFKSRVVGGRSHTYSLVLAAAPERVLPIGGYLDTCFFVGQDAANIAPPRTSRREPPHAMKIAAPNSNLNRKGKKVQKHVFIVCNF